MRFEPYAYAAPIFLCEENCTPVAGAEGKNRKAARVASSLETLFDRLDLAWIDPRSARNTWLLARTHRDA